MKEVLWIVFCLDLLKPSIIRTIGSQNLLTTFIVGQIIDIAIEAINGWIAV